MKVLIINTYDNGGAANACLRLHEGLLKEGIDSKVLLYRRDKPLQQTFQFDRTIKPKNKFQILKQKGVRYLQRLGILNQSVTTKKQRFKKHRAPGLELFSFPDSNFDITDSALYQEADIINLHWVANFLDYESFFRKNTKPVVWTLHDMNPFTGGEHYLETSLGMDASGFPITRNISEIEKRIFKENLTLKVEAIQAVTDLNIVAPSKWLCTEAENSLVFKSKKVFCIPYGINADVYQPRDRNYSRNILNLQEDKTVILFVADSIKNHRKGYTYLLRALEKMQRDDIVLCAVGSKKGVLNSQSNVFELGTIYDERLMSMVYSAADVFVIPSLMDNLPNTVLESLMCGTPVIGFPVGGIPDMVQHGVNGYLTENISAPDLLKTLNKFLKNPNVFNRSSIRNEAVKKYDEKIQAAKYTKLFKELLQ